MYLDSIQNRGFVLLVQNERFDNDFSIFHTILIIFEFWWSLQSIVVKKMRLLFERITRMATLVLSFISLNFRPL